jgi:RecB family exonuclease
MQLEPWGGVVELAEIVDERWSLIECEPPWQSRALHRQAGAYLVALAEYLQDRRKSGVELVASEFRFELALDDVVVSGSVDRIEREADGSLVVVDLKTGAVMSERDAAIDPQLSAYQLALADPSVQSALETTAEVSSAWLLFVRQGKSGKAYTISQQPGLGAEGFEQFRQRLREARALVAAASFRGPREAKNPATNALSHRWQRVGSVCGD